MREILFRAKRLDNGEWVEGYLIYDEHDNLYRIVIKLEYSTGTHIDTMFAPRVSSQTIGQYTGLTDKNGTKIFEGDILKSTYPDEPYEPSVVFEEVFWNNGWYQADFGRRDRSDSLLQRFLSEYSEVFGNRWDDAELLEVKR